MKYLVLDSNRAHFLGSYVSDTPLTTGSELLSPEKNPRLMEVIRIFECSVGGPGVEEFNGEIGYELIVDGGTYLSTPPVAAALSVGCSRRIARAWMR